MKKTTTIVLFLILVSIPILKLFGQERVRILPDERVRVWTSDFAKKPLYGTLVALNADTLVLEVKNQKTPLLLPVASVTKFEVLRGKKRFGIGKGAGLGFLAGALTGAIVGYSGGSRECESADDHCFTQGQVAVLVGAAFGGLGILSGSFIGAVTKVDKWDEIPVDKLSVTTRPNIRSQKPARLQKITQQSIYVEVLGTSVLYSINYDRMFTDAIGGRIGVMYLPSGTLVQDETHLLLPITVNYFVGSSKHKLEMGAGVVLFLAAQDLISELDYDKGGVAGTLFYGYRFQPVKSGILFRIGFTPIFGRGGFLPWGGLSLGIGL